jgi:hypothetical protein
VLSLKRRQGVRNDEVARFRRDGFVAVPRPVVRGEEIDEARRLLDALFDRAAELPSAWVHDLAGGSSQGCVPEIVNCAHVEPKLLQTRAYRTALKCARRLIGRPVQLSFDHAIFKPGRVGAATALHQDLAFNPTWDVPTATIWLALVDATEANGCMRFLPQTPSGLLDHEELGRDALGAIGLGVDQARAYPVPTGGFTVHSQRAVHGSGPNETSQLRAAWILKFERDDRPWRWRVWERFLERGGVVAPRRFEELCRAVRQHEQRSRSNPPWVAAALAGAHAGRDEVSPSGDQRA